MTSRALSSYISPAKLMLSVAVAHATLNLYSALKFRPANPAQYTILSSFTLSHPAGTITPISLATGSKCLPATRLSPNGDAVHDSHAEVLARRGAIRWLLEEVCRSSQRSSEWIEPKQTGKWGLKTGVSVHMYISTLPCGDASMRTLAATPQDPAIAALKSTAPLPVPDGNATARGRDNYSLLGVLRTKPGRADSPPTLSMSCSDKIARWCVLGFQGALASHILDAIYVDEIILGGVDTAWEAMVREDCRRAFWERIESSALQSLPPPFELHPPQISFTRLNFPHGRPQQELDSPSSSCNESLCWIANSSSRYEVLIHGLRRGVGDKQRLKPHLRPLVSKLALFGLYQDTLTNLNLPTIPPGKTYHDIKQSATAYQTAKQILHAPHRSFTSWVVSGKKWENFTVEGVLSSETNL